MKILCGKVPRGFWHWYSGPGSWLKSLQMASLCCLMSMSAICQDSFSVKKFSIIVCILHCSRARKASLLMRALSQGRFGGTWMGSEFSTCCCWSIGSTNIQCLFICPRGMLIIQLCWDLLQGGVKRVRYSRSVEFLHSYGESCYWLFEVYCYRKNRQSYREEVTK